MDGVIIVNKPKDYTSNDIVQIVRKTFSTRQVGHCGTLDPMATGVLPILIGQGTKLSKYLVEHQKTYIATIKLGEKTDTADETGKVIEQKPVPVLEKQEIKKVLETFLGKQLQTPPMYSAIKKNGKKLYEYAREGKTVEIPARQIEIHTIKLLEHTTNTITYEVKCSKGTYIRTLSEQIAEKLNTVGYMQNLIRTSVNQFTIQEAIGLEQLNKDTTIISIEEIFKNNPNILLNNRKLELFLNGVKLTQVKQDGIYKIYSENQFIGLRSNSKQSLKTRCYCRKQPLTPTKNDKK